MDFLYVVCVIQPLYIKTSLSVSADGLVHPLPRNSYFYWKAGLAPVILRRRLPSLKNCLGILVQVTDALIFIHISGRRGRMLRPLCVEVSSCLMI
jgi:hypothetical protein